jgi:hypothetical protein
MSRKNRRPLGDRIVEAAEAALAHQDHVSVVDLFAGIGWLYPGAVGDWQNGRIEYLQEALQTSPERLAEALVLLRSWATGKGLIASEASYVSRSPQRQTLRFFREDNPSLEQLFRTRWVSPRLSEAKRERLEQKADRAPELVVIEPLNREWKCHRCGGTGDLLVMEKPGPACLSCVGLGDLEFLPSGDALLTRRVKARSARHAVVVRFSRSRRRYERQGLLVEPKVLAEVEQQLGREGRA